MMEGDHEDNTSKLSFMKKSMSLNMNFHLKSSQDGSLTRHLNSFQNPMNPGGKQPSLNTGNSNSNLLQN